MKREVERDSFTPREVAIRLGVSRDTVAGWIRSGELAAYDVSTNKNGRPYYRVTEAAIEQFRLKRSVSPPPKVERRRPEPDLNIIEFY